MVLGNELECDFKGRLVRIITSAEPPHVSIDSKYAEMPLIEKFGTYNVTNYTSGILVDLIHYISKRCNFKYEIHVDQDPDLYGGVWKDENNGTILSFGMFHHAGHPTSEFEIILGNAIVEHKATYVVDFFATILTSRIGQLTLPLTFLAAFSVLFISRWQSNFALILSAKRVSSNPLRTKTNNSDLMDEM